MRDTHLDALKWLAMFTMALDHLRLLRPDATWLFTLGRIAFPLFCLAIAANVARRAPGARYLLWLLAFCVLCEGPYRLLFPEGPTLNIMPTLLLGLLAAWGARGPWPLAVAATVLAAIFHEHLMYGLYGVLLPAALTLAIQRSPVWGLLAAMLAVLANSTDPALVQAWTDHRMLATIAVAILTPLLGLWWLAQPGTVRVWPVRRWGYFFYPVHLLLIWLALIV